MFPLQIAINFCSCFFGVILVFFMYIISVIYRPFVILFIKIFHGDSIKLVKPSDAFLAYEHDTSSNIVMAIKCKGVPNVQEIYKKLEERTFQTQSNMLKDGKQSQKPYNPYNCLLWKLVKKYFFFCWEKCEDFNFSNHFIAQTISSSSTSAGTKAPLQNSVLKEEEKSELDKSLQEVSEFYLEHKFNSDKPAWVFHLLIPELEKNETGFMKEVTEEFAIIFCVHHSYGDGMSWIQLLRNFWSDKGFELKFDPLETPKLLKDRTFFQKCLQYLASFWYTLTMPLRVIFIMARSMCESHLFSVGSPNSSRSCGWKRLHMKQIHAVREYRKENGNIAKFTTVIYSCIAYAYRQFFLEMGSSKTVPKLFHTAALFANFPYKSLKPTNRTLVTPINIPIDEGCRNKRFAKVDEIIKKSTSLFQLKGISANIRIWGSLIIPFLKLVHSMDSLSCSLVVSNLLGPEKSFTMLGGYEVTHIIGFPPLKVKTSVSLCMVSYKGSVDVCLVADNAVTTNFPLFVPRCLQYFSDELENLTRNSLNS